MTNQLMESINKIISAEETVRLLELHEMNQSHMLGLQGFKRLHRFKAMDRERHSIMLQCFMAEYYHLEPNFSVTFSKPIAAYSFLDSIKSMYDKCKDHITSLKIAAKMAFDEGEDLLGDYLEMMVKDQSKEAECYWRLWLDCSRQNADLNYISKELHEKMKHKEKKYYNFKN
jgi:hypothetical protein